MNQRFLHWAKAHREALREQGIVSDILEQPRVEAEKQVPNPAQVVYYSSPTHIGVITVWQAGFMDMETLKIANEEPTYHWHLDERTGKMVAIKQAEYYRHVDDVTGCNFDDILEEFFQHML